MAVDALELGKTGLRWAHVLAGITWIGLLYFFNFVQPRILKAIPDEQKKRVTLSILRPGLLFFRWAALATWAFGMAMLIGLWGQYSAYSPALTNITAGMLLGTFMFLNVWGVIWRYQKRNLAAIEANLASGAPMPPEAAVWVKRATFASRANVVMSIPMLFFMVSSGLYHGSGVL
jgi:uncharacterized membrane protein